MRDKRGNISEAVLELKHLRTKRFFGTSENAVKSQVWIAVATPCAGGHREKKRLRLDLSWHAML